MHKYFDKNLGLVHQLASSGGTVMFRSVMSWGEGIFLNEVNPYELRLGLFTPTDLIALAANSYPVPTGALERNFRSQLRLLRRLVPRKTPIVLRVHSHFDFFPIERTRKARDFMQHFRPNEIATVREPVANFLSARRRGFVVDDFQTYISRYERFLDSHDDLEVFLFEKFLSAPDETSKSMCKALKIPQRTLPLHWGTLPTISGDKKASNPLQPPKVALEKSEIAVREFERWELKNNQTTTWKRVNALREKLGYPVS